MNAATQMDLPPLSLDITKQVEITLAELEAAQAAVTAKYVPTTCEADNPQLSMLAAKEKALKAQICVVEESSPRVLPDNPKVHVALLKEELSQSVEHLGDVLSLLQSQRDEIKMNLKRQKQEIAQHSEINTSLSNTLGTLSQVELEDDSILQNLTTKRTNILEYERKVMRHMVAFLQEHFPPPVRDAPHQNRRKSRRREEAGDYVSLKEMLEVLMTRALETPNESYLTLDSYHWPPYVELLLRCGIAIKNPKNDKQIKLTPFHL